MKRDIKTANDFASDLGLSLLDPMYDAAVSWFLKGGVISDKDYDQFLEEVDSGKPGIIQKKLLKTIEDWNNKTSKIKTAVAAPPPTKKKPKIVSSTILIPKTSLVQKPSNTSKPNARINPNKLFCSSVLNGPNNVPFSLTSDLNSIVSKTIYTSLLTINKSLKNILKFLIDKDKIDKKILDKLRIEEENQRRLKKERDVESTSNKLNSNVSKVLTPIKNIFDKILKFISTIFLAKAFSDALNWMADPKNRDKIKVVGRFLKDFAPALLGAYLLFGTKFGSFVKSIGSILKYAFTLIKRNPKVALAVTAGTLATGALLNSKLNNSNKESQTQQVPKSKSEPEISNLPRIQAKSSGGRVLASNLMLSSNGMVSEESGINITGAGSDTQLIAAQPGEIVMNKDAVDAIGADKLLALNRKYGGPGANKPNYADDIQFASKGGMVGKIRSFFSNQSKPNSTKSGISIPTPEHQLPEMRSALEAIKFTEGTNKSKNPYNTLFGFGSAPITKMSVKELIDLQTKDLIPKRLGGGQVGFPKNSNGSVQSAASGAYQFMPDTLRMLVNNKILKMDNLMNPDNQDRAATELMKIRGVTSQLLRTQGMSRGVIDKLAPEWSSFPTLSGLSFYNQPAKPHHEIQSVYNKSLRQITSNGKKNISISPPKSKQKIELINLPPINQPMNRPTSSVAKPNDVSLFETKFPETRRKTTKTYGLSI